MSKVTATYSGFVGHEGVPVLLHEGQEFDANDSLVKARPELFTSPPSQPAKPVAAKPTPARATGPRGKAKGSDA